MGMERPAWTIAFFVIWILVIPGVLLTHISVGKLIPVIKDLPDNVVKGFDEVFRFSYLEQDAKNLKSVSATALTNCNNFVAATSCPNQEYTNYIANNINTLSPNNGPAITTATSQAKQQIDALFASSLSTVNKVANDKYFGNDDLAATADKLNAITEKTNEIMEPTMDCTLAIPVFCEIYNNADGIVNGMSQVTKAIDEFKNSDAIDRWDDNASFLQYLHAMPYLMVLALVLFSIFWLRGGVCCCCRGGTKSAVFALFPFAIFWLVSFIIYAVVFASGTAVKYYQSEITTGDALRGKPTLKEAIDHIQTEYPKFWNVVFADMVDPLDLLLSASYFFVAVAILILVYALLECCCMPYRKSEDDAAANS
jgi:hypothetical protein